MNDMNTVLWAMITVRFTVISQLQVPGGLGDDLTHLLI